MMQASTAVSIVSHGRCRILGRALQGIISHHVTWVVDYSVKNFYYLVFLCLMRCMTISGLLDSCLGQYECHRVEVRDSCCPRLHGTNSDAYIDIYRLNFQLIFGVDLFLTVLGTTSRPRWMSIAPRCCGMLLGFTSMLIQQVFPGGSYYGNHLRSVFIYTRQEMFGQYCTE